MAQGYSEGGNGLHDGSPDILPVDSMELDIIKPWVNVSMLQYQTVYSSAGKRLDITFSPGSVGRGAAEAIYEPKGKGNVTLTDDFKDGQCRNSSRIKC